MFPMSMKACLVLFMMMVTTIATVTASAHESADSPVGQRWALILVGLPGDSDHQKLFDGIANAWQKWLIETAGFESSHVIRIPDSNPTQAEAQPITADAIHDALTDLGARVKSDDALWLFTLGHGNHEDKRAWFHVAGRDPSNEDFGRWLSEVRCREQVFWLTHSSSGKFVRPLSRPNRIVIAATAADDEANETEFPQAMANVMQQSSETVDGDGNGRITIAEFYRAIVTETNRLFENDERLPTEHAQVDDNGDGVGTEELLENVPATPSSTLPKDKLDGQLARNTVIRFQPKEKPSEPNSQR